MKADKYFKLLLLTLFTVLEYNSTN